VLWPLFGRDPDNSPWTYTLPDNFNSRLHLSLSPLPSADLKYKAIPLTCIKLIEVDRLGSGVRFSPIFSNFWFNSRGNVLGGEVNCPGNGTVRIECPEMSYTLLNAPASLRYWLIDVPTRPNLEIKEKNQSISIPFNPRTFPQLIDSLALIWTAVWLVISWHRG